MEVEVGQTYKHFKGNEYQIIALAKDCETLKDIVVYQSLKDKVVWIRDYKDFVSEVKKENYHGKRFLLID